MKKQIFVIGLILLTGLNIVLLFTTNNLYNRLEAVHEQSLKWGFEHIGAGNAHLIYPSVEVSDSGLSLQIFLTDKGCTSCVINEIRNLNILSKHYRKFMDVYFKGSNSNYLESFYIQFSIEPISEEKKILDNAFRFYNPVALLIDENGMVHRVHMAEPGNPAKTNRFYERIASLFKSLE